ncbi:MAG: hypothetical protein SVZ03_02895 [Spirochaetota bacterium]|nr:hypothetical protein [Spirochaetota bacterium]
MNPIVNILTKIIIQINKIIDSINIKTIETIKQVFYLSVFIFVILGIIIGYYYGKDSAEIHGTPIAGSTNEVFQIDIKRERKDGNFRTMLETEILGKNKLSKQDKIRFPSNEKLELYLNNRIAEPDDMINKIKPPPLIDSRDRLSKVQRIDEVGTRAEIEELKRRGHYTDERNRGEILREKREGMILEGDKPEVKPSLNSDSGIVIRKKTRQKGINDKMKEGSVPQLIKRGRGIIDR